MLRIIIEDVIKISRGTFEYNDSLYRGYVLEDIEISKDINDGFLDVNWGEIRVSIYAFGAYETLREKKIVDIKIYFNDTLLFDGIGEKSIGENSYAYTLYSSLPYQDKLLMSDDNDSIIPLAFGTVAHYRPLLKDDTTYTYYLPDSLTVNSIADDGVSGVDYTTDDDGNISLDNAPIGQISFNVASDYTTVSEILAFLSNCDVADTNIYNDTLNIIVANQTTKIDMIKSILKYTSNIAYINNDILEVYKKDYFATTIKVDNFNHKPLKDSLSSNLLKTYKTIKANFTITKGVFESNVYSLKDESLSIVDLGENPYAGDETFNTLETNSTDDDTVVEKITTQLERYKTFLNQNEIEVEMADILSLASPTKVLVDTLNKSGTMIVSGISHKLGKSRTTILRGYGNVDFKQI